MHIEEYQEEYSLPQLLAFDAMWRDSIMTHDWESAEIIGTCSTIYNCHGYAWHMSDGGDTIWLPYNYDVSKYYNGIGGENATYKKVNGPGKYRKVYYNGASHSGIVDPDDNSKVISKWGPGPLVRHDPEDCPFDDYTLEYYELIIDDSPNSVAKGCATDVTTLDINNATYNWAGINSYVCASGSTYIGQVTGLNTSGYSYGEVKVEVYSPFSNTTVKGIKQLSVTAQPTGPTILEPTTKVCPGGTSFTLNNVPAGNTVTWTSSSNISVPYPHANPCTFYSTGNGSGWVKASVSTGCAQGMFPDVQKSVWSGVPVISYISGPNSTPNNQWATYNAEPYNPLMTYSNSDYNWTLNPLNGNSLHNYGHTLDIAFYNSGNYQLVVNAENTCGSGSYAVTFIDVYDSRSLSVSPNPGNGEVTISIEEGEGSELKSASNQQLSDEDIEWELEVYDNTQNLKEKKIKLKGDSAKIQTAGWKEGVYVVRVKYKEDILTDKLVVKK